MATKRDKKSADTNARVWAVLRILIGLIFLWAFADKMFGLGFSTCRVTDATTKVETVQVMCDKSVIKGGSATTGFLSHATDGPLQGFYNGLAGNQFIDTLFMAGLFFIGLSLVTGIGVRIATVSGMLLLLMMWSAVFPKDTNPIVDDHIINIVALFGILKANKNQVWGFGNWWKKQNIAKKYSVLT
jgi:thiosulfate dehydrogenase [quinone] large subunit